MISAHGITHIGGSSNTENQDKFFIGPNTFGVFDGHGLRGGQMAAVARDVFAAAGDCDLTETFAAAEEATKGAAISLTAMRGGGTTAAVLSVAADGACRVAHVGDSEVRYFDEDTGDGVSLTADHSPASMEEFLRVLDTPFPADYEFASYPGRRNARPMYVEQDDNSWTLNPAGGNFYRNIRKEWASYLVAGMERLSVSRALGDFTMKARGVIATPSILSAPAPVGTRAIVLASDGLWDCLQYDEVRAIVRRPDLIRNAAAAATALMEAGLAAGQRIYGPSCDNITVVVVYVSVA